MCRACVCLSLLSCLLTSAARSHVAPLHPLPPRCPCLQVQALWRDLREISGGAMLMHRRVERAMMRRRLENAVAMIAGARRGGGGGGGGAQIGISAQVGQ